MNIEQARNIANTKLDHPPTEQEWERLFAAEKLLEQAGEPVYVTYNED